MLGTLGALALGSVLAYLASTSSHMRWGAPPDRAGDIVHPAERWLVLANGVAFGSAYVAGAWSAGFILVLVLHHEVQYLYFTYAMARRTRPDRRPGLVGELRLLGSFAAWPTVGPRQLGGRARPSAAEALEHFIRARERFGRGDFAGFGEELKRLEEALRCLQMEGRR